MRTEVAPKLKPLYANLLRLGIGKYLISKKFQHLCIENDMDELWDRCKGYVRSLSSVAILVPGYTGYAEDALGIFLTQLIRKGKEKFIEALGKILVDFAEWTAEKPDFGKIRRSLSDLGYGEEDSDWIFSRVESKPIGDALPAKRPQFKVKKEEIDEKLCFVLMPFDEKFTPIYNNIIKKVIESFGLECKRADEIFGTRRARFMNLGFRMLSKKKSF